MPFRPEHLSQKDVRQEAEDFLAAYHEERTLSIPIEEIAEFDFEIEIVPMLGLQQELRVDAFLTSDLERIFVDEEVMRDSPVRYRFSLAHELGPGESGFDQTTEKYAHSRSTSPRLPPLRPPAIL